jgi:hypothetical protein
VYNKENLNKAMQTIKIDENSRILLEEDNYTLEYRVKSGMTPEGKAPIKEFKWIIGGYFPTLASLATDWVSNAPSHQKDGKIQSLQDVVECIQKAEVHIEKLIKGK